MKYKRHCETATDSLVLKDVYRVQSLLCIRQWTHFPTHSTNRSTEIVEIRREEVHERTLMRFFLFNFGAHLLLCFISELTFCFASFRSSCFALLHFGAHLCAWIRSTPFCVFRSTYFGLPHFVAHLYAWFRSTPFCARFRTHFVVYFVSEHTFSFVWIFSRSVSRNVLLTAFQVEVQSSRLLQYFRLFLPDRHVVRHICSAP